MAYGQHALLFIRKKANINKRYLLIIGNEKVEEVAGGGETSEDATRKPIAKTNHKDSRP